MGNKNAKIVADTLALKCGLVDMTEISSVVIIGFSAFAGNPGYICFQNKKNMELRRITYSDEDYKKVLDFFEHRKQVAEKKQNFSDILKLSTHILNMREVYFVERADTTAEIILKDKDKKLLYALSYPRDSASGDFDLISKYLIEKDLLSKLV